MVLETQTSVSNSGRTVNRRHALVWVSIAVIAALIVAGVLIQRRDERLLQRKLVRLARLVEKSSAEQPLTALNRLRQIGDYFAAEVELAPGPGLPTTLGRQEVLLFIQNARSSLQVLQVRIREQKVAVAPGRASAVAHVVVEVTVGAGGENAAEIREGIVEWKRDENGQWKIHRLRAAETIRNPALSHVMPAM